jgi:hypothetical protein
MIGFYQTQPLGVNARSFHPGKIKVIALPGTPRLHAPFLSLDRALEQGCDDLALKQHEEHQGG